ncbi:DUF922 domain-containing Zn-dependent protease [Pseudodesulfovibrio portus]|uniref:Peptidase n=1 Tax=Pseudodesulfovibrio portus TaxID=231439 RepID=A0ABN6RQ51_9BACT|nr:DUF922 domain-containing Zn-dependent protease [Pseudodesulfovibrio portus]BDQ32967.1 peptidase [Pseudodesulfovibrio portus]
MRRLPAALLALLLLASPAAADVVRTVKTEYYTVQGTDPASIAADLQISSPWDKGLGKHTAVTRTKINIQYKMVKRGRDCSARDVKVYLHLTYLYPKLARSVDGKTYQWWKGFLAKLEEHELIHGEISSRAAHALSDELEALVNVDCVNFKAIAKNRFNRFMTKLKQDQAAYDKLTEHGIRQERNRGRFP